MKTFVDYWKSHPIELVGFFWLGLLFLAVLLTMLGVFYKFILAIYIIFGGLLLLYTLFYSRKRIRMGYSDLAVILISLAAIILLSYFTAPSVFSGRDQGSFSEAAANLTENHKLEFSYPAEQEFFKIYGPGKALNFPGFDYTKSGQLVTQFPIGYTSWLAIFYAFFGINGFIAANAVTFFIFLLSFYLLGRAYLKPAPAFVGFVLILSSFIFSWFFKLTLGENLAMALVWFGMLELAKYFSGQKNIHLAAALFSFYLLAFTRVEALAFILIILVLLFKSPRVAEFKKYAGKIILVLLPFVLIYLASLYVNRDFYIAFLKGFLNSPSDYKPTDGFLSLPIIWVFRVFILYGFTVYIVLGIVGIYYLGRKKIYNLLLPFLVLFPTLIYLVYPGITLDQPWMLRRYSFSVLPLLIFYSIVFLYFFFEKRKQLFYFFSALLFISNLTLTSMYFLFSENENLLPQIAKMSQNFQNSDLILVDREATGSGFAMMSGPMNFLYAKQAVYFINPADLDRIDKSRFSHVYFIIPDKNIAFYQTSGIIKRLSFQSEYEIDNTVFNDTETKSASALPQIYSETTHGGIYLLK